MYKVLLVDDEPIFRQGLLKSVDWEAHGFEVCGEAGDGEQALEMILEQSPHLVITDIKMPAVDGLKLIEHVVNSRENKTRFIVLSGYGDFAYAQTSIRFGVRNYILKPVDFAALAESIDSVFGELEEERQFEEERNRGIRYTAENTIRRLARGEYDDELALFAAQWLNLPDDAPFSCVIAELDNFGGLLDRYEEKEIMGFVSDFRARALKIIGRENALNLCELEVHRLLILANRQILEAYSCDIVRFTDVLGCEIEDGTRVCVYVGEGVSSVRDTRRAYESALDARSLRFFHPDRRVFFHDELGLVKLSFDPLSGLPVRELLFEIEHGGADGLDSAIDRIYELFQAGMPAPELIRMSLSAIVFEVLGLLSRIDGTLIDRLGMALPLRIRSEQTPLTTAMQSLREFCSLCLEAVRSLEQISQQPVVCKVMDYMKRNYMNDIYLKGIADLFQVNPVYLGQLFKRQYGVYFNDYLNKLRIAESKRLLATTDMKISKIARAVGYANAEYFTDRFERATSISPAHYRRIATGADKPDGSDSYLDGRI